MKFLLSLFLVILFSFAAQATSDIAGRFNKQNGFTGRFPIAGGIGSGSGPPATCNGSINLSTGCAMPMFGGL